MPPKLSSKEEQAAIQREDAWDRHIEDTLGQLQQIYTNRVEPVEARYLYNVFRPTWFSESIKQKKPFVTFLGPFSAGKSSFINYLLQNDVLLTGPQPVTDKFTVVMYGQKVQQIPGRVLMADARQPFRGLSEFGDSFAECFAGVLAPHPILRSVSFVDTPGILEAAGDAHSRRYNYAEVCRWFVEKSDLVFFLFDPTKLDAGPEMRQVFTQSLKNHESKIRIVMNKADAVRPQELLRVYGSLYWNLSNLVRSTEPPRLYVSSFWDKPYRDGTDHALFEKEKEDLLYELIVTIPLQSLDRRVTTMMKRASDVLLFAMICATYRTRLPSVFGKGKAKEKFYEEYNDICRELADRHHVSVNNFPTCAEMKSFLTKVDSHEFPEMEKLEKRGWVKMLKAAIDTDLPRLLQPLKENAMGDPRDRRGAIMMQRKYITRQVTFPPTVETSLDGRDGNTTNASVPAAAASAAPPSSSAPSADPQAQMMMMMQQMMAMQQQQMQNNNAAPAASNNTSLNQSSASYAAPSPPPPAPAAAPPAAASASNEQMQLMMQNMMAMMMQQQMQQQQPSKPQ